MLKREEGVCVATQGSSANNFPYLCSLTQMQMEYVVDIARLVGAGKLGVALC